jgi:ferredoxin-type protein NapF
MTETLDLRRRSLLLGRFADAREPTAPPVAVIGQSCFALRGVACMSCRDVCPTGAVRFELALGGARPRIMTDACTGCSDCSRACPADAIRMSEPEPVS